jgi:hypothetical protein
MATFTDLANVRLILNDPAGFTGFAQVANAAALPATPLAQTAYNLLDTGAYVYTEKASAATLADYTPLEYRVSDARLSAWFDAGSEANAVRRGFAAIMQRLGAERLMEENGDGAEKTKFTKLTDLMAYYKQLLADYEDSISEVAMVNTGRYGAMKHPTIAGGYV